MPRLPVLSMLAFALCIAGCAAMIKTDPPHAGIIVDITNVFPDNALQAGTKAVTLSATVANDPSHSGVKWSLTVANVGCSPGCGTLVPSNSPSFSAVYTPPATAPLNQEATITAIAVADPRQYYAFNFAIIPLASVSITDKFSTTIAGAAGAVVNAQVSDDPTDQGVTWSLTTGGSPCSPACGTLAPSAAPSFAALYTPPPTVPSGAAGNPTITATAVNRAAATDSFSFTIASPASLLKGSYAFLVRGYDSASGNPMAMAGSIAADGNGNITGGEVDFNNGGGIDRASPPATGTYSVDVSFNGIPRVAMEITSYHFPGSNIDLRFRFVLSADGSHGRIIELDGSGYLNAGTILLQDSGAMSAQPSGSYAFGLDSDAPLAGRIVAAGQLVMNSSGVTGGVIDESKSANASPIYTAAAVSPSPVTAPDSNGRGTLSITVNGNTSQYAYYVVKQNLFNLVEIDPAGLYGTVQAGVARLQQNLTASSVNATSVLQYTGMDEPTGTSNVGPAVGIGVLTIIGGAAFNLNLDTNDLGTSFTSHLENGDITFDPATGRAVLSSPGGFEAGFVDSAVLYLYDTGSGFFIDTDISTPDGTPPNLAITNNAFSGIFTQQSGSPFSVSNLSGNVLAGFGGSASPSISNLDVAMNFDGSTGAYTALADLTSLPSQDGEAVNAQFSGTYTLLNRSSGHGTVTLPAAVLGDFTSGSTVTATFYMIAPNKFVGIAVTNNEYTGVIFFDPQ